MLSEKTVEFIMALWEEAGEPWRTPDGVAAPKALIREAVAKSEPQWADAQIAYLKGRKAAQKAKKEATSPSASSKQLSFGIALDKKVNGFVTHDWANASMSDAWQWIKELKDAASVGAA